MHLPRAVAVDKGGCVSHSLPTLCGEQTQRELTRGAFARRHGCHRKELLINTSIIFKQKKALQILTFKNLQSRYLLAVKIAY